MEHTRQERGAVDGIPAHGDPLPSRLQGLRGAEAAGRNEEFPWERSDENMGYFLYGIDMGYWDNSTGIFFYGKFNWDNWDRYSIEIPWECRISAFYGGKPSHGNGSIIMIDMGLSENGVYIPNEIAI